MFFYCALLFNISKLLIFENNSQPRASCLRFVFSGAGFCLRLSRVSGQVLQILPRGGHPSPQLMVDNYTPIVDFYHQVNYLYGTKTESYPFPNSFLKRAFYKISAQIIIEINYPSNANRSKPVTSNSLSYCAKYSLTDILASLINA